MKYKLLALLIPVIGIFSNAKCQDYNKDSILKVVAGIRQMPPDTGRVRLLREAGYSIIENDSALSKTLLEEALAESLKIKEADAVTNSYRMLGIWHRAFGDKDKALELYRASLHSATSNNHLYLMAGAYFNIGNIKYEKGEYDSCVSYFLKANEIFDNPKIFDDETLKQRVLDKKKSDFVF